MPDRVQQRQEGSGNQAGNDLTINNNYGLDLPMAIEVFNELAEPLRRQLTAVAQELFEIRTGRFRDEVMAGLNSPQLLQALADPDFQLSMRDAQEAAARTDDATDFTLLTQLLRERAENQSNSQAKPAVRRALQAVPFISHSALSAFAGYWWVYRGFPVSYPLNSRSMLDLLDSQLERIQIAPYPSPRVRWWDEFVASGCLVVDEARHPHTVDAHLGKVHSLYPDSTLGDLSAVLQECPSILRLQEIFYIESGLHFPPGMFLTAAGIALVRAHVVSRLPGVHIAPHPFTSYNHT